MTFLIALAILAAGVPLAMRSRPYMAPGVPLTLHDYYPGAGALLVYIGGIGLISALIAGP